MIRNQIKSYKQSIISYRMMKSRQESKTFLRTKHSKWQIETLLAALVILENRFRGLKP